MTVDMGKVYDAVVVGGGFFGLCLARCIKEDLGQARVLVIEKEQDVMQRASYNNQARVHGGYHYPRSLLTGLRSQANFLRFVHDFEPAILTDFDKYYAIATNFSKVSSRQFKLFCDRIGADIMPAPQHAKNLFDPKLIEDVFKVKEYAFNTTVMKKLVLERLSNCGVELKTNTLVERVTENGATLEVHMSDGGVVRTKQAFNCSYSLINQLNAASDLPLLPFKHELAEMALITLPEELKDLSVTVMCGPFFSFMPFPARNLTTLSHVRYTPHSEWNDKLAADYRNGHEYLSEISPVSHFRQMISDAQRYMPVLGKAKQRDSLWEIKTVLPQSEHDDSRPILFRKNHGVRGYHCVLGGKLDNIYDAYKELDSIYA